MAFNDKVQLTIEAVDKASAILSQVSGKLGDLKSSADKSLNSFEGFSMSNTKAIESLKVYYGVVDKAKLAELNHQQTLERLTNTLGKGHAEAYNNAIKKQLEMSAATEAMNTRMALAGGIFITAAAVVVGTGMAINNLAESTAVYADQVNKMTQRTGIAAEQFTALQFAAGAARADTQDLAIGLKYLEKNISEAGISGSRMNKEFERLGVSIKDAKGNTRDTVEIFKDVADKISHLGSGADRTRESMVLMGRGAQNLLPMLMDGKSGIEALMQKAKELGATTTTTQAILGDKFITTSEILRMALDGNTRKIGYEFLPMMIYMKENTIKALSDMQPYFEQFAKIAGAAFEWLMIFFKRFSIAVYEVFADVSGIISIALTAISGIIIEFVNRTIRTVNLLPGVHIKEFAGGLADSGKSIMLEFGRIGDRLKKNGDEFINAGKGFQEFKANLLATKPPLNEIGDSLDISTSKVATHTKAISSLQEAYNKLKVTTSLGLQVQNVGGGLGAMTPVATGTTISMQTVGMGDVTSNFDKASKAAEGFGLSAVKSMNDVSSATLNVNNNIQDLPALFGYAAIVVEAFSQKIKGSLSDNIFEFFKTGALDMQKLWGAVTDSMLRVFSDMVANEAIELMKNDKNFRNVFAGLNTYLGQVVTTMGAAFGNLLTIMASAVGSAASYIGSLVGSLLAPIAAFITQAFWALTAMFAWTGPFAPGIAAGIIGAGFAAVAGLVSQVKLADGGVVTGPTNALIGEGGQPELVLPLSKAKDMGFMGGASSGQSSTNITIERIDFYITKQLQDITRADLEQFTREKLLPVFETMAREGRMNKVTG